MEEWDFVVIGGGAAGFFSAIVCGEAYSGAKILILEATSRILTKVKVSGGGRCNVTHAQFDPKQLVCFYPRGNKELKGPFHRFQPKDTVSWFEDHGVQLKVEDDGRMFPITNDSQTIIDCLTTAARNCGVLLRKNSMVQNVLPVTGGYEILIKSTDKIFAKHVLLATGSMPYGVNLAEKLTHTLVSPVPSLFTFQIKDPLIEDLSGISFPHVKVTLKINNCEKEFIQEGACLITHWGLSGPAVLKLSAFAARELFNSNYKANMIVNWQGDLSFEKAIQMLEKCKKDHPKKKIANENPFDCVKRFWDSLLKVTEFQEDQIFADVTKKQIIDLANKVTKTNLVISGKGVFKDEFVTAGGVSRNEIDFRNMESKIHSGLYFSGEVLDIDGVTGGFNFQNAWTGSWLVGNDVAKKLAK